MLKIPRKTSVCLSLILASVFMLFLVFLTLFMGDLVRLFINVRYLHEITAIEQFFIIFICRFITSIGILADILLILLLRRAWLGTVFTPQCIAFVRAISWCAIFVGLLFILLAQYFIMAYVVAFAGVFLGLCLRVVKNVIEEATAIKDENDLTV